MSVLYCWRSGIIAIGREAPDGALALICGSERRLRKVLIRARLAYDGKTWLVPGVPETKNDMMALKLARSWVKWARGNDDLLRPAWEPERKPVARRRAA